MNVNTKKTKKQVKAQNSSINVVSAQEMKSKIAAVEKGIKSYTWRDLETNGKFTKNDKLSFISDDMLIVGCDIGSEIHYIRAIDTRGRELSREVFSFSNNEAGFQSARDWMLKLASTSDKKQIVLVTTSVQRPCVNCSRIASTESSVPLLVKQVSNNQNKNKSCSRHRLLP